MAQYKINDTTLIAMGDAIREKSGLLTKEGQLPINVPTICNFDIIPRSSGYFSFIEEEVFTGNKVAKVKFIIDITPSPPSNDPDVIYLVNVVNNNKKTLAVVSFKDGAHQEIEVPITDPEVLINTGWCEFYIADFNVNLQIYYYDANNEIITSRIGVVPNTMTPQNMIDEINNLPVAPEEAFNITGNFNYRFSYGGWDWYINAFGNRIKTSDISSLFYCFGDSNKLENIPFDLNITNTTSGLNSVFIKTKIKVAPNIIGPERKPPTGNYTGVIDLSEMFKQCSYLREIPEDYFWKIIPNADYWEAAKNYSGDRDSMFYYNYSLRKLPDISMLATNATYYGTIYYSGFSYCHTLDEIINLPVVSATLTSNAFYNSFYYCYRLKDIIFLTNEDGTPKTANWKSQTIDLTYGVGYSGSASGIINYNSGITADKEVKDQTTYDALKDDPDWFATNIAYSRYNKTSAVNTINSLPDTSAYGTNTIKFYGIAGSSTDGGAINTLTEEEIAVAAAKGWTVSLS